MSLVVDEEVVVISGLTKHYGNFVALNNFSITLNRGQILGLIGPNGAGKTTAIKILVGLSKPTAGTASITGVDCVKYPRKVRKLVGYMPDTFGSYDNMRVREYLDFFGAAFGIGRNQRNERIDQVLETTNATYMQDRYVEALSHGMKQRIGIARTLLHDPEVLILDEPANGLDPQSRIDMRVLLLHLASLGKTLIVTSHILPELSRICDQVAILTNGQLRASGTLEQIMREISQERTIEAQLAADGQCDAAADLIAKHDGINSVESARAESMVRFRTTLAEGGLGVVLADLIKSGINVTQFRELQVDLEDAYLSVTQQHQQPVAPMPAAVEVTDPSANATS